MIQPYRGLTDLLEQFSEELFNHYADLECSINDIKNIYLLRGEYPPRILSERLHSIKIVTQSIKLISQSLKNLSYEKRKKHPRKCCK